MKFITFFILLIYLNLQALNSQQLPDSLLLGDNLNRIIIMEETGVIDDNLPVMKMISDTSKIYKQFVEITENTFIKDVIDIYFFSQNYLNHTSSRNTDEAVYFAITKNIGGFAKKGFILKSENNYIPKKEVPYIDIHEARINDDLGKIMSITQLFPHEMGHIIFRMISSHDQNKTNANSLTMHYFSLITDYSTAFNEGFAEHFENAARLYERNDTLQKQIMKDIKSKKGKFDKFITGYKNDFIYPYRIGYYKASMIIWYQQYEDLIRYEHSINKLSKYKNSSNKTKKLRDKILYRNSGVEKDTVLKNLVQSHMTEGVIATFFTKLLRSDLKNNYQKNQFYRPFFNDTSAQITDIKKLISPLQNHYIKCIYVLSNFVNIDYSEKSQFHDFLAGYMKTFPNEANDIEQIYFDVTGHKIDKNIPKPLWLLTKNNSIPLLVLDSYGSIILDAYSFDLNAAEKEDLMMIEGISDKLAEKIINFRKKNGFYEDFNQLDSVDPEAVNLITASIFDDEYVDQIKNPELNLTAIIISPIKDILLKNLIFTTILLLIIYALFLKKENINPKRGILLFLKYYLYSLLIIVSGLFFVIININILFPLLLISLAGIISYVSFRKNKARLYRSLTVNFLLALIVFYSMI